jgi:uncharacterized protein (DUF362 family)
MNTDKIYVINADNPVENTQKLLEYLNPIKNLNVDSVIGIKPNLVCARPASDGATTHPEIVEGIILYLINKGFNNIKIIEGSWVGDSTKNAFKACGYIDLSIKYHIPLIDTKDDEFTCFSYKGMDFNICKSVQGIDYLINVPLIKGHCQTKITCSLKNMKGLIPDFEKRRYHTLGLHKPIAFVNKLIIQNLIIADAICPDPYFEEGGSPHPFNKIFAAFDPVLIDSYAARMLGYKAEEIEYINIAEEEGIGSKYSKDNQVVDLSHDKINLTSGLKEEPIVIKQDKYLNLIDNAEACSACYSNLVSALKTLSEMGLTEKFSDQISIGQLYKGYKGKLGIGDCTCDFCVFLKGCPPKVEEIVHFLKVLNQ